MKKIILAGMQSGSGKTTVSAALMRAFALRGLEVAPFKVGPDYIDPKFHEMAVKRHSCNLDGWMLSEDTVRYLLAHNAAGADIAVIEGVMGLFDGCGSTDAGSTAHITRITGAPVILIADAKGMSRSVAAMINGFCSFDTSIRIAGVIVNRVSGERHYSLLKKIIEENCPVPCLGYFPYDAEIGFGSRHLGLIQADEVHNLENILHRMSQSAIRHVDIDKILALASSDETLYAIPREILTVKDTACGVTLGVARDKAFSFYYRDNLSLLEYAGVTLKYFSPLEDAELPAGIEALYLGGGYPEVFAEQLSSNKTMREDIKTHCENGMPVYAECGGLIYLLSGVRAVDDQFYPMAGFFSNCSVMTKKSQRFGYATVAYGGIEVKAHEFHHSILEGDDPDAVMTYSVTKANEDVSWKCGLKKKNVLAGYPHIHFYSNIDFLKKLILLFKGES